MEGSVVRAFLIGTVIAGVCSGSASAVDTIVVEDWWNIDYAKLECNGKQEAALCKKNAEQEVRNFVLETTTGMAASTECAGVSIVTYAGPQPSEVAKVATTRPYWSVSIDFNSGRQKQEWWMLHSVTLAYLKGEADPEELAKTVCAIVTARGTTN